MKRCVALLLLTSSVALLGAAPVPEVYTIKLKDAGKGVTVQVELNDTSTSIVKLTDAQGQVLLDKTEKRTEIMTYRQTVLEVDGTKPTMLERQYAKAQMQSDGKTTDLAYHSKTVVIEKKDDKYTFTIKGGAELKGEDAQLLDKEFNTNHPADIEKLLLPKAAVRVNEEWKLDMQPVLEELGKEGEFELDKTKATGTGKLLKAYKKDGKQFGELQFKLALPLNALKPAMGLELKAAEGAQIGMDFTLDTCIDGTMEAGTFKGAMKITVSATGPLVGEGTTLDMDIVRDVQETRQELPKK